MVEFHRFPLRMNIRVLSKAYQTKELLAFHRVIALFRTDRDRERILALPRLFALPPFEESRSWGFGPSQSIHCI